jgi:Protein of unknown function (DUF3551)
MPAAIRCEVVTGRQAGHNGSSRHAAKQENGFMAARNRYLGDRHLLKFALATTILAGVSGLASPAAAQPAWTQAAPWCANMGGGYGFDCSYFTFAQCMATARGLGGYCSPNPRAQYYVDERGRRRRVQQRY